MGVIKGVLLVKGDVEKLSNNNKNKVMAAIRVAVKRRASQNFSGLRPASTNRQLG